MFDRRVVRGNTHSSNMVRIMPMEENLQDRTLQKGGSTAGSYQKQTGVMSVSRGQNLVMTPRDLDGYNSCSTMTEEYIEVLSDKPDQRQQESQTDFLLNKPSVDTNTYVLNTNDKKSISTQIVEEDLLFDFDVEVESILQVLRTKILEQSRMEVLEEEELAIMKDQHRKYIQLKNAELAEVQRLEANERRISEEMGRRIIQNSLITGKHSNSGKNMNSHKQMCSRVVSKSFLRNQEQMAISTMEQLGFFIADTEIQLHSNFVPWLYEEVFEKLEKQQSTSELATRIITNVENHFTEMHSQALENRRRKQENIDNEKRQKLKEKDERRQKRKEEKARAIEEERITKLKALIKQKLIREPTNTKNKLLFFTDVVSSVETDQKEIVGLPGGMMFELYCVFEAVRKFNEETGKIGNYKIDESFLPGLLRLLGEWFAQSEWTFEITYNQEVEEKLTAIVPEVKLNNAGSYAALNNADLDPAKKIEFLNTLGDNLTFAVDHMMRAKDYVRSLHKPLARKMTEADVSAETCFSGKGDIQFKVIKVEDRPQGWFDVNWDILENNLAALKAHLTNSSEHQGSFFPVEQGSVAGVLGNFEITKSDAAKTFTHRVVFKNGQYKVDPKMLTGPELEWKVIKNEEKWPATWYPTNWDLVNSKMADLKKFLNAGDWGSTLITVEEGTLAGPGGQFAIDKAGMGATARLLARGGPVSVLYTKASDDFVLPSMMGMSISEIPLDVESKLDDDPSKPGYEINESVMSTIKRGLAGVFMSEDHEKYSRYMKLTKTRCTGLSLDAMPALCVICPESEDDDVQKTDLDASVDSYKVMRGNRYPKADEDLGPKMDEVVAKKFFEQKFDMKATPVNTNHNEVKVLANHRVMSLHVKRDLIQATLQLLNPKIVKDKDLTAALLESAVEIGEFANEEVWTKLGAKIDILDFKNY